MIWLIVICGCFIGLGCISLWLLAQLTGQSYVIRQLRAERDGLEKLVNLYDGLRSAEYERTHNT